MTFQHIGTKYISIRHGLVYIGDTRAQANERAMKNG